MHIHNFWVLLNQFHPCYMIRDGVTVFYLGLISETPVALCMLCMILKPTYIGWLFKNLWQFTSNNMKIQLLPDGIMVSLIILHITEDTNLFWGVNTSPCPFIIFKTALKSQLFIIRHHFKSHLFIITHHFMALWPQALCNSFFCQYWHLSVLSHFVIVLHYTVWNWCNSCHYSTPLSRSALLDT